MVRCNGFGTVIVIVLLSATLLISSAVTRHYLVLRRYHTVEYARLKAVYTAYSGIAYAKTFMERIPRCPDLPRDSSSFLLSNFQVLFSPSLPIQGRVYLCQDQHVVYSVGVVDAGVKSIQRLSK